MKVNQLTILFILSGFVLATEAPVLLLEDSNCNKNIHEVDSALQCKYISLCEELKLGKINFLKLYFCYSHTLANLFLPLILLCSFLGLGITASEFLTPNLHFISKYFNLSDNLAGLTLVALGNSSPDILSNYKAMNLGHADLALSELIGACFFIVSWVVGIMSVLHPFKVPRSSFIRDVFCFLVVASFVLITLLLQRLNITLCLLLICCYLAYVTYVVVSHSIAKKRYLSRLRDERIRNSVINGITVQSYDDDLGISTIHDISNLPTIEDLNFSNMDDTEYHNELNNEMDQLRLSVGDSIDVSNTYAIKQLINELTLQKKPAIQLENERPFGITMSDNQEVENQFNPVETTYRSPSYWRDILELDSIPSSPFYKVSFLLSLPVKLPIKLSTPVSVIDNETKHAPDLFRILCTIIFLKLNFSNSFKAWLVQAPLFAFGAFLVIRFQYKIIYSLVGFLTSILWISIFATEIINALKSYAIIFNISDVILGFTVFALGNCIGDFISNYTIALLGMPIMAFGACFGGPILSLTFMGANGLVIIAQDSSNKFTDANGYIFTYSSSLIIMTMGLIINLVLMYALCRRNNWHMNENVGYALIINWIFINLICVIIELV